MAEDTMGFNLGGLGELLTGVRQAYQTQTLAEDSIRNAEVLETNKVRDSATAVNELAKQEAVTQLQIQQSAAAERELANGKPTDLLGLMALQVLDPTNFTEAGRNSQAADSNQRLQLGSNIHSTNIAASEARLAAHRAKLAGDLGATERSLGIVKAQAAAAGTLLQGFTATEQLRLSSMSQMPMAKIDSLLNSPALAAGAETVDDNGFKFSRIELQERKQNLMTRDALSLLQPIEIDGTLQAGMRAKHDMFLQTSDYNEMLTIRDRGGVMDDGSQVDTALLDAHIARRAQIDGERTTSVINQTMATQAIPNSFMRANSLIEREATMNRPANSNLYLAQQQYRSLVGAAAIANESAGDNPQGKMVVLETLQQADAMWDTALQAEATLQASGDTELSAIIYSQLSGRPVDPKVKADYIVNRYTSGQSFSRVLTDTTQANQLQMTIDTEYQALLSEATSDVLGTTPSAADKKDMRSRAAMAGIQKFQVAGAVGVINTLEPALFSEPTNPMTQAGIVTGQFQQDQQSAIQLSMRDIAQQFDVDVNAVQSVMRGQWNEVGLNQQIATEMINMHNQLQVGYLYDLIDQRKPGLAGDYVDWLGGKAVDQSHKLNQQMNGDSADMLTAEVHDQAQMLAGTWMQAHETRTNRGQAVIADFYSGANNPELLMRATIGSIRELTDQQKSALMEKIINPVVAQASKEGLDPNQTAERVMAALDSDIEGDPGLSAAARRALRSLPASIAQTMTVIEELRGGAIKNVEDRSRIASSLSSITTGTEPSRLQLMQGDLLVREGEGGFVSPNAERFLGQPGGPEALIEALRNK